MIIFPIHKAQINFDDELTKESYLNLIANLHHKNINPCYHVDILKNQLLLVKVEKFQEAGSVKDLIYGSVIKYKIF